MTFRGCKDTNFIGFFAIFLDPLSLCVVRRHGARKKPSARMTFPIRADDTGAHGYTSQ